MKNIFLKYFKNIHTLVFFVLFSIFGITNIDTNKDSTIDSSEVFATIATIVIFTICFSLLFSVISKLKHKSINNNYNAVNSNSLKESSNQMPLTNIIDENNVNQFAKLNSSADKTNFKKSSPPKCDDSIDFPDWYISISFGKSTSDNYAKALALAKSAPQYHEQNDNGVILHQAIYSSAPKDFRKYLMLYELVGSWKSSFVMINGELIDRKVIGKLNYCYGDRCRIGNSNFCYGASYMTDNPFGCHRLQISAANNPWWSFYEKRGNVYYLNKAAMKEQIDSYANIYRYCPLFDYENIINELNNLPSNLPESKIKELIAYRYN